MPDVGQTFVDGDGHVRLWTGSEWVRLAGAEFDFKNPALVIDGKVYPCREVRIENDVPVAFAAGRAMPVVTGPARRMYRVGLDLAHGERDMTLFVGNQNLQTNFAKGPFRITSASVEHGEDRDIVTMTFEEVAPIEVSPAASVEVDSVPETSLGSYNLPDAAFVVSCARPDQYESIYGRQSIYSRRIVDELEARSDLFTHIPIAHPNLSQEEVEKLRQGAAREAAERLMRKAAEEEVRKKAEEFLLETVGEENYKRYRNGWPIEIKTERATFTVNSEGKLTKRRPSAIFREPLIEEGYLWSHSLPMPDLIASFYLWAKNSPEDLIAKWGCGKITIEDKTR